MNTLQENKPLHHTLGYFVRVEDLIMKEKESNIEVVYNELIRYALLDGGDIMVKTPTYEGVHEAIRQSMTIQEFEIETYDDEPDLFTIKTELNEELESPTEGDTGNYLKIYIKCRLRVETVADIHNMLSIRARNKKIEELCGN